MLAASFSVGEWVLLIAAGCFAAFLVLIFFAAFLETRPITLFVPLQNGERLSDIPYTTAMQEAAAREGFTRVASNRHAKGGRYIVHATTWLSPDQRIAAQIAGGKMFGCKYRRTLLTTRLLDGTPMVTTDEGGSFDLSGFPPNHLAVNADFSELLQAHTAWIDLANERVRPFDAEDLDGQLDEISRLRAQRMIDSGYARFIDPTQTKWKHTLKGALVTACKFFDEVKRGASQRERNKLARPGDSPRA